MGSENQAILSAINVVKAHLDKDWISEGCFAQQEPGCASCWAVDLRKQLTTLEEDLAADDYGMTLRARIGGELT